MPEPLRVRLGGYKGAGLNFMIGAIAGVMTGAAFGRDVVEFRHDHVTPTNTGQSILVFRPDLFGPRDAYDARMGAVLDDFRTSESATGAPIRLPGDNARATAADNLVNGVPVPGSLRTRLNELAGELGLAPLS